MPGTVVLSLLSSSIFGFWLGFVISLACSVFGASVCYHITLYVGSGFVENAMPDKLNWLRTKVQKNKHNLFYYFLFLRFTPLCPNWFLNLSSGIVGVPFHIFVVGSTIGLGPYTYILCSMGTALSDIEKLGIDANSVLVLFVIGLMALIPTYFNK
jgi:uncharacterized membrane protein YdjX (TVP38/TMEM64 family)